MMKRLIIVAVAAMALVSCGKKNADDPLADTGRTQRTENLLANLKEQAQRGYMFGHHDDTVYGIGWFGDSARSDVKSVCNDLPALLSFDLGHIELGDSVNLDKVPFDRIRQEIIAQFDRGGVTTLSWHLDNPLTGGSSWVKPDSLTAEEKMTVESVLEGGKQHEKFVGWIDTVADYLNSLTTQYGVKVPVIFRPFHEHTGSWFWWGQKLCTPEQYKALWKMVQDRFKEKEVTNVLFAYSPGTEPDGDEQKYMERYPGDDIIDIVGFDAYCDAEDGDSVALQAYADKLEKNLKNVTAIAKKHGKLAALTETGYEGLKTDNWWTATLAPVLNRYPIAYVLVWRNAHERPTHFFAPYPGQRSTSDFIRFYNDKHTFFIHDINALYLKKDAKTK